MSEGCECRSSNIFIRQNVLLLADIILLTRCSIIANRIMLSLFDNPLRAATELSHHSLRPSYARSFDGTDGKNVGSLSRVCSLLALSAAALRSSLIWKKLLPNVSPVPSSIVDFKDGETYRCKLNSRGPSSTASLPALAFASASFNLSRVSKS